MNRHPFISRLAATLCLLGLVLSSQAKPVSAAEIADASDRSFHSRVLTSNVPVLVEFWAPWCVPCRHLEKSLEAVASEVGSGVQIIRVDISKHTFYARRYGVSVVPTMMVFKGGEMVDKVTGALSPDEIRDMLKGDTASTAVVASLNEP